MIELLLDPSSAEVAWDYCLENNIILPGDVPLQYWMQGIDSLSNNKACSVSSKSRNVYGQVSDMMVNSCAGYNVNDQSYSGAGGGTRSSREWLDKWR